MLWFLIINLESRLLACKNFVSATHTKCSYLVHGFDDGKTLLQFRQIVWLPEANMCACVCTCVHVCVSACVLPLSVDHINLINTINTNQLDMGRHD